MIRTSKIGNMKEMDRERDRRRERNKESDST